MLLLKVHWLATTHSLFALSPPPEQKQTGTAPIPDCACCSLHAAAEHAQPQPELERHTFPPCSVQHFQVIHRHLQNLCFLQLSRSLKR